MTLLERARLVEALQQLDSRLGARGERAELFLLGGTVMCVVHKTRPATKEVDEWFTEPRAVRDAAREVAEVMGLPENWLNDAAKGFLSPNAGYEGWESFPPSPSRPSTTARSSP